MKRVLLLGMVLAVFVAFGASAYATTAALRLTSGTTTITVFDNGAGDTNALPGVITFNGTVGNWNVFVTTGVTKPAAGSATSPLMDLSTASSAGPGPSLTISFSDTGFGPAPFGAVGKATLSSNVPVSYQTYWNPGNVSFGTTNLFTSLTLTSGGFSSTFGSLGPTFGSYSLTQTMTVGPTGTFGVASVDAALSVPEPSELLLIFIGLGVACIAGLLSKV